MMVNDFGDSKITVKKHELLDAIKKNRAAHAQEVQEALASYRREAIKELEEALNDARDGKKIRRALTLVEPQDHIKDYDRVIRMLQMSTAEDIVITERQFSQYVLDEWDWMNNFKTSNARYLGK